MTGSPAEGHVMRLLGNFSLTAALAWSAGFVGLMFVDRQALVSLLTAHLSQDGHIASVPSAPRWAYFTGVVALLIPWILYRICEAARLHVNPYMTGLSWSLACSHATFYRGVPVSWVEEDGVLGWATVYVSLVAIALFLVCVRRGSVVAYILAMLWGLFVLEELSWGQRLLDLESPLVFAEHNRQAEINIHNFVSLSWICYAACHLALFSGCSPI